ncbi:MAG: VacJ family lipoprotein [Alphaproteobacteria bacterium]|nr:VacJ family lipoprotein [Alphaproteobacteria bacterium]
MNKVLRQYIAFLCVFFVAGCASSSQTEATALENYNRTMFNINNQLEKVIIRPVAKGYRAITNEYMRQRLTNFFNNISEPVSAANHLLQGEWHNSAQNISRFMINTTIGGLGLYDVAAKAGLEQKPTGFDETLATWCVPDGPYIILPVLGPSTPRATTGWVADGYSSPAYWVANESNGEDAMLVYYGAAGLKYLNKYAENLKLIEGLEESSIDYYEAVKTMYLQNRGKIKSCGKIVAQSTPDYDFDMDDED